MTLWINWISFNCSLLQGCHHIEIPYLVWCILWSKNIENQYIIYNKSIPRLHTHTHTQTHTHTYIYIYIYIYTHTHTSCILHGAHITNITQYILPALHNTHYQLYTVHITSLIQYTLLPLHITNFTQYTFPALYIIAHYPPSTMTRIEANAKKTHLRRVGICCSTTRAPDLLKLDTNLSKCFNDDSYKYIL